jgi:O-acetyl-ADP-ribose deacetylase (regulator of RNase III)
VARAIRLAAGDGPFQRHCDELIEQRGGPIPTGRAIVSESFDLPCRAVIHAVGPVYGEHDGREPELLAMAYRSAIECASERGLKTLAFPAISCGIYGYPLEFAAETSIEAVMDSLEEHPEIELVRFCFVGEEERSAFERAHRELAAPGDE